MLKISHLSVEYQSHGRHVQALKNISFSMEAGETLGVVGESGSGKSTLALAILRLLFPHEGRISAGSIVWKGQDLLKFEEDQMCCVRGREISFIFQDPFSALNPVIRIDQQMKEVLSVHRLPVSQAALVSALEDVQLPSERILSSYPHQLSGGERQRVMIAMALLTKPSLLLADEPTTALDVIVQREILELLFALQKKHQMSVLFISHNLGLVAEYTQRVIVLKRGEICEDRPTLELLRSPQHPYTQELIKSIPRLTRTQVSQ